MLTTTQTQGQGLDPQG